MNQLQELSQNLHLVLSFAKRDIRAKYKQTVLGAAWAVIQPLSLMVVFTFVFSMFARSPSEGLP
ncbi:MAG: ABC transporter permease, partial [Terriglobales bacterium]